MRTFKIGLLIVVVLTVLLTDRSGSRASLASQPATAPGASVRLAQLPIRFEANRGQTDPSVRYLAHLPGYTLFLTKSEIVLAPVPPLPQQKPGMPDPRRTPFAELAAWKGYHSEAPITMHLVGARSPSFTGVSRLPGRVSYLLGSHPRRWHTGVPTFAGVEERGVYPGVDLAFHGSQSRLEYDCLLHPGASPERIRLQIKGGHGVRLDTAGNLVLADGGTVIRQARPAAYQVVRGERRPVPARFVLHDGIAGIRLGRYDRRLPVVIDPSVDFADSLGGSGLDTAVAVGLDKQGDIFVAGNTQSSDFPKVGTQPPGTPGASNAYVAELDPTGANLLASIVLGGNGTTIASDMRVNGQGHVVLIGNTDAANYPTTAGSPAFAGGSCSTSAGSIPCAHGFVTQLNPATGSLDFSRYLGGSGYDAPYDMHLDRSGNIYIGGWTSSKDYPVTPDAAQKTYGGDPFDAVVTELDPTGAVVASTYLGGDGNDAIFGITVDQDGNVYVAGGSSSSNLPQPSTAATARARPATRPQAQLLQDRPILYKLAPRLVRFVDDVMVNPVESFDSYFSDIECKSSGPSLSFMLIGNGLVLQKQRNLAFFMLFDGNFKELKRSELMLPAGEGLPSNALLTVNRFRVRQYGDVGFDKAMSGDINWLDSQNKLHTNAAFIIDLYNNQTKTVTVPAYVVGYVGDFTGMADSHGAAAAIGAGPTQIFVGWSAGAPKVSVLPWKPNPAARLVPGDRPAAVPVQPSFGGGTQDAFVVKLSGLLPAPPPTSTPTPTDTPTPTPTFTPTSTPTPTDTPTPTPTPKPKKKKALKCKKGYKKVKVKGKKVCKKIKKK